MILLIFAEAKILVAVVVDMHPAYPVEFRLHIPGQRLVGGRHVAEPCIAAAVPGYLDGIEE